MLVYFLSIELGGQFNENYSILDQCQKRIVEI